MSFLAAIGDFLVGLGDWLFGKYAPRWLVGAWLVAVAILVPILALTGNL